MLTLIMAIALQSITVQAGGHTWTFHGSSPTSAWWVFDIPTGAYQYIGPSCWSSVLTIPPPDNCRVIRWRQRDLQSGAVSTVGYMSCDLAFYFGADATGGGCWRGTPISDPTCNLNGTSSVMPGFMQDTQLRCP